MNRNAGQGVAPDGPAEAAETLKSGGIRRTLRSRGLQVVFSLALAGGLLYLFLRQVRIEPLKEALGSASGSWLAASLSIAIVTFWLRAVRWTWLLRPVGRVPAWPAFLATAVGFAGNNLPARVGEVIRPALLSRMRGLPFSPLLASILFERALDGGSVVFFFLLAVLLGLPGSTASRGAFAMLRTGALAGAAVFLVLIGLALLVLLRREATERFFDRLVRRLPERWRPRIRAALTAFPEGFASLSDPRLILLVLASSLTMWFVINVQIYAVMRAFHIDLPFSSAFVITAAAVLGLAVPTPGGIGSYQAAVQYGLTHFYGVEAAPASGVAVAAWAISFVPITLIGLGALASRAVREPRGRRSGAPDAPR